jgi:hypothetical protein
VSVDGDLLQAPANADALANVVVRDLRGNDVRLGDLWSSQPALLVFLRHYG